MSNRRTLQIALTAAVILVSLLDASAQQPVEYVIGPGDVLSVSVWRHPELERNVVVRSNGMVTFPPIGDLKASGLTPTELSREMMQRLRDYTRETTQVTISMSQFNSRAVYLTGQVMAPGRYSFESLPDLLQLLSQAGGPLPGADLSNVSIVRPSTGGADVIKVDVSAYMRGQVSTPLPSLRPGDTVEIPSLAFGGGGIAGGGLVYILGEVTAPGAYPATDGLDLLQLIAIAGGTTPQARFDDVAIVMDAGGSQVVANVNLRHVIEDGTAAPFMLGPGDRVVVAGTTSNLLAQTLGITSTVLGYGRDILSSYLLYLSVEREVDDRTARAAAAAAAAGTP
ncbi:MAG: polysaccharide biosynthesis/export family protein [Candidatus Eisenbacteria bacterium]